MALRLLSLAAAATVAADVVQVVVLCDSRSAAGRAECDMSIAAVDAINNKTDGVFDDLLPNTVLNLTVAYEGCGEPHPVTGLGDDAFEVWKALPVQPIASIGPWCSSKVRPVAGAVGASHSRPLAGARRRRRICRVDFVSDLEPLLIRKTAR